MAVLILQVGGSSCLQCAATHAESSASSKESEQPSPVSVLEPPFVEDISSGSECFERVSAELHGENLLWCCLFALNVTVLSQYKTLFFFT